jgi:hypothetical protein
LDRKARWTLIAQPTVWSPLIVFPPIVFDHHPRFFERPVVRDLDD